jgi:hydroxyacylglutathione hydrolase
MLFERIESEGIAHYSYLVGRNQEAVVIDPRRDCRVYVENAAAQGMRIVSVLETHRNEDYLIGSLELAELTGAQIWHADRQWDYRYGLPAEDGQEWTVGGLKLKAIASPGHTTGMMSYLLHDEKKSPWMLFTGDALFAGDVGRVDLMGKERIEEMAGMLHETLFHRLLPLGDGIIVCPAHGSGSVCGAGISDRAWTTIGLEREHNPKLQFTERGPFIEHAAQDLEKPPYFLMMEKLNTEGPPVLKSLPVPSPLNIEDFLEACGNGATVVDTRGPESFGASHIPGAISIWLDGLPNFAGWFLSYDSPILLVCDNGDEETAVRFLSRLGYDAVAGRLSGGMLTWHKAGEPVASNRLVTVQEMCSILDKEKPSWLLDVRSEDELEQEGRITGAHHIHITQISQHLEEIPRDTPVYIFCGSGLRSTIAASILQRQGWQNVAVVLGGFAGWNSVSCPVK